MKHKPLAAALALPMAFALALLATAGCAPQEPALIQAGSQKVTADDFNRAGRGSQGQYTGPPERVKAQLSEDLLSRALMLEMAHQLGHEDAPVVKNTERDQLRRALIQALYFQMASPAQRVSEAEALALYEARKFQAGVSMIYTSSRESSLGAKARLAAGEPFEQVSQSLSLPGLLPPDGNMGMIAPGSLPDPLDGAVRSLPVGEIGGPYQTREGWFLVKITQRVPREQGTYEALRAGMYDLARQRKQRAAFNRTYQDMKDAWHFALAPGGSQLLFRVMSPVAPIQPSAEQQKTLLATYDGGQYTLRDAFDDMRDANVQRPPAQVLPALEIWIEQQVMTRVAELEARRRHLDETPEIIAQVRAKREELLLEGIYQGAVAAVPPPGPELVRMAWEQVKDRFTRLIEAQVAIAVAADTATVAKLVRQGAQTRPLAEAASQVDPAITVSETTVKYPTDDPQWSSLQAMFTQMQPGAWFGPEPTAGGYRVLQLVSKSMQQQAFEDLPEAVRQNIAGSAADLARESRFKVFRDSLVQVYHPVVNQQAIAKLAWPPRPTLDVGR